MAGTAVAGKRKEEGQQQQEERGQQQQEGGRVKGEEGQQQQEERGQPGRVPLTSPSCPFRLSAAPHAPPSLHVGRWPTCPGGRCPTSSSTPSSMTCSPSSSRCRSCRGE